MNEEEEEAFKEHEKAASKKYFLKNWEAILKKADLKHWWYALHMHMCAIHGEVQAGGHIALCKGKLQSRLLEQPDNMDGDGIVYE
ncbi:hypothetical protein BT96DRAFT_996467 [Gymnopus androsaceus JB14]|uniref:Uncharacterized protein n=1 Tax=Gymnopus androsaceus JB14 TaxID=1447944 RepID=A0A6A4HHU9_9AGAR|nr:hypothetical protein BT96DRAFT_996467 [Gymnopus androsaceus JB14]